MPRFEVPGGTVHLTWRLHPGQEVLKPEERSIVLQVIARASEFGATLRAGVVMDDHVHVLFDPGKVRGSMDYVRVWKAESSRLICKASRRIAPLWQRDSYQRWMRSDTQTAICVAYIKANPRRKWPGTTACPWLLP